MSFQIHPISRRTALRAATLGGLGLATAGVSVPRAASAAALQSQQYLPLRGRINHSVHYWPFTRKLSLAELCQAVKQIGFSAISHLRPDQWSILKAHGVDCPMCLCAGALNWANGFATKVAHEELVARYLHHIDLVADAGYRNLLCFSGTRRGMSEEESLANAESGLKRILGHAEKRGVVLAMAMWNSKYDFPGYLCDNSDWGVALCKRLSSPNFGLLYDAYHMQIMEGNIIATIRKHHEHFVLYLTGGLPGRCEIGDNQELNYPAICRAIVDTGFQGYLTQEFNPSGPDHIAALRKAVHLCDV